MQCGTATRLELLTATELDNVFSGRQPRQMIYKLKRFGDQLHLHHQGDEMMEMELVSETLELTNHFQHPSARENLIQCGTVQFRYPDTCGQVPG